MPSVPRKPICVACGDTGLDSRGNACHPCLMQGRLPKNVMRRVMQNYEAATSLMDEPPPMSKITEPVESKPPPRKKVSL